MFGIDTEKLIDKLKSEVIPEIMNQDAEDIIKYNLALRYLADMSELKQIGCLTGALAGSVGFFALSSPIIISLCATGAIASGIAFWKTMTQAKRYEKLFKVLIIGLEIFHDQTPEDVGRILENITAQDLVDFLEKEGVVNNE